MPPRLFSPDPLIGQTIEGYRLKRVRGADLRTGWVYYSAQNPADGSWASVTVMRPEREALGALADRLRAPDPDDSGASIGVHGEYLYILRKEPDGPSLGEWIGSKRPPRAARVLGLVAQTMSSVVSSRREGFRGIGLSEHDIFVRDIETIATPVVVRRGVPPIPPAWLRRSPPAWAESATDPRLIAFDAFDILTHGITGRTGSLARLTPKSRAGIVDQALGNAGVGPTSGARRHLAAIAADLEDFKKEAILEEIQRELRTAAREAGALRGPRAERPPGEPAAAAEGAPAPSPRFVNLHFRTLKGRPVSANRPLVAGWSYDLRVSIGELTSQSVVENAPANPVRADLLPESAEGHWLEIAAVSTDFEVPRRTQWLFLPRSGPAFVCPCAPNGSHRCSAIHRSFEIDFRVRAPAVRGPAHARVTVYFEKSIVQSLLVTATIVPVVRAPGSNGALIDYNLTNRLTDLDAIRPRALGVMTNDGPDGTHLIIFNGAPSEVVALEVTDGQLTGALQMMRAVMRGIHIEEKDGGKRKVNRYDAQNAKPREAFVADLRELAARGWQLWHTLWGAHLDVWLKNREGFLRQSDVIHVARKKNSTGVYPWAIVYDIPIETGAPERHRLCRLVEADEWRRFGGDADAPRRCPFESEHATNVICPYGFWGYRYGIESPPSIAFDQSRPEDVQADRTPLDLVLALSEDLDLALENSHVAALKALPPTFTIHECRSRDQIKAELGRTALEVAYFYCHGRDVPLPGGDGTTPRLGVGRHEAIDPPDLVTWRIDWPLDHWRSSAPLVFINGCHTADTTPQTLVNFVDTFSESLHAKGVIGTEITLHQQVANEMGLTFLDAFRGGARAADALHRARIGLLRKGNLLGLVYTAYCWADLQLKHRPA